MRGRSNPSADTPLQAWTHASRSVVVVAVLAAAALGVGPYVPGVNTVVVALVLGAVAVNIGGDRLELDERVGDVLLKRVLKGAIVLLGAGIDLRLVAELSAATLGVIVAAIVVALGAAVMLGRVTGLGQRAALLVGIGTAICGASAIAAAAPLLRARREEIGLALAAVFSFNALALLLYPIVGRVLELDALTYGTWAGVAVHDTASALATGFALGAETGQIATVVKLTRTLFLIPLIAVLAVGASRVGGPSTAAALRGGIPWFVLAFFGMAALGSLGWLGPFAPLLDDVARIALVPVIVAVGMTLRLRRIAAIGGPTLVTGLGASVAIGVVALALASVVT